jgi:hypothetical protein
LEAGPFPPLSLTQTDRRQVVIGLGSQVRSECRQRISYSTSFGNRQEQRRFEHLDWGDDLDSTQEGSVRTVGNREERGLVAPRGRSISPKPQAEPEVRHRGLSMFPGSRAVLIHKQLRESVKLIAGSHLRLLLDPKELRGSLPEKRAPRVAT